MQARTSRLSTAAQLGLGFAVVVAFLIALGAASAWGLARMSALSKTVYDDRVVPLGQLSEVTRVMLRNRVLLLDMFEKPSADNVAKRSAEVDKNFALGAQQWKAFLATSMTAEETTLAGKFDKGFDAYNGQGLAPAVAAMRAGRIDEARSIYRDKVSPLAPAATEALEQLVALQVRVAAEANAQGEALSHRLNLVIVGLAIAAALIATAIAVLLTRGLVRKLGAEPADLAAVAERIAQGDLSKLDAPPAIAGSVMASMQTMHSALTRLVTEVRAGIDSVATASAQIAAGNQDLSSRTEQQASSLQETAASMEQMTAAVRTNADSARQADGLARGASEVAGRGGTAVSEVVSTMGEIQAASRRIEEIISVIDGIAFQTNILALNAAVEAARAGEQGRGFAVVAGEVRNLAQRSAQAAKEIKSLISDSVQKIDNGSARVQVAGQTIDDVVQQVNRVSRLIGEITASTAEQSSGITQVSEAVTQLDQVTQQNAALVEQGAAAAASLREQADKLARAIAVFRLSQDQAAAAIASAQHSSKAIAPKRPVERKAPRTAMPAQPQAPATAPAARDRASAGEDWKEF
ncbi:MAG: methyl-accepting chemotaxis protein [Betaproteobacteria bacterium]|jgi:methyl-accepting chemotaxis protein-1 (serine sensor receptor)